MFPSGYPIESFLQKPADSLMCCICHEVLKDPRQCPAGHLYCKDCITMATNVRSVCPCGCNILISDHNLGISLIAKNLIEEAIVYCKCVVSNNPEYCCTWKGPLHQRSSRECGVKYKACVYAGCHRKILDRLFDSHVTECSHRTMSCPHCKDATRFDLLSQHVSRCDFRPVVCECGHESSFTDMCHHNEVACPLVLVACPLFAAGACGDNCSGKTSHSKLRSHVESQMSVDLVLGLATRINNLTDVGGKRRRSELFIPSADKEVCEISSDRTFKRSRISMSSSCSSIAEGEGEGGATGEGIVLGRVRFPAKNWHATHHHALRVQCCDEITFLLRTRRPNATNDWREKLPSMAKRLENALYQEADGLREYSDWGTLRARLQSLALSMSN